MKFALVNGQRQEAQPGLSGQCPNPNCGHTVIAKCGEVRIWHWAHQGRRCSDLWWENETPWHRAWKDQFPIDWQEVIHHHAETGEKHIADVKTDRGWVIEFQHSYLKPEERRARETFYGKLIWVVDGTGERASARFLKALDEGVSVGGNLPVRKVYSDDCALLRKWADSHAPIFFDLGELQPLWWSFARSTNGWAYVGPFPAAQFIESHRGTPGIGRVFDQFVSDIPKLVADYESHRF